MLIPEYGASKLMYIAIMTPANRPVNRARRGVFKIHFHIVFRCSKVVAKSKNSFVLS